ncbi:uncharacterized protein [Nicotiana sylvestris]|uniref:uncharacterized protein n=1 Tax=Nicotiana sylvestris TaxID=4096 RepID=UPI00388CD04C
MVPPLGLDTVSVTCNEATQHENSNSDEEDGIPNEIVKKVENFENNPKSNLDKIEAVNLGDVETVKETRISIHLSPIEKEEYICFLKENEDIFAWSYDDITGLRTSIVAHKLPTNPMCPPVKQKLRKFKPEMSLKIKEEVTKQSKANVLRVVEYPTWTAQKLRHYFCAYTTYLISRMNLLKYIFQKPMPTGKLAKWQKLLREDITEAYDGWRMFFNGAVNFKKVGIRAILVSEMGQHYPVSAKLRFSYTNNMVKYEACILGLNMETNMNIQELLVIGDSNFLVHHVQGEIQNEFADALATLSSMIQHPNNNYIDHIPVKIHNQLAYCAHVEEEIDGKPWFHDIKEYLSKGEYLEHANHTKKRTLRILSNHVFHSRGNLYKKTPDLGLLRCVDAKEGSKLLEDVHVGSYGPHMNGFVLAKKILRAGYFWMKIETDCIQYVRKCFQCQVEVASYKAVTKKVVADFVKDRIVCRFGVLESIVIDNAAKINSDLMKVMCETFKLSTRIS